MSWALFNPFQRFFCIITVVIFISQVAIIYNQQYNKKKISLSCPKIPIASPVKPQKIDLSGLRKVSVKIDAVIRSNNKLLKAQREIAKDRKKLDKIIRNQWKVDRIIQKLDAWGVEN